VQSRASLPGEKPVGGYIYNWGEGRIGPAQTPERPQMTADQLFRRLAERRFHFATAQHEAEIRAGLTAKVKAALRDVQSGCDEDARGLEINYDDLATAAVDALAEYYAASEPERGPSFGV
jgi:hypothetical protein